MKLMVECAESGEVFTDTVRIPAEFRRHPNGKKIENGDVLRIEHEGRCVFAIGRGLPARDDPVIYIDEFARQKLGVQMGSWIDSRNVRAATRMEQLMWYRTASNPAVRIAAEVALVSLLLGGLSVVLGILGLGIAIWIG